MKRPLFIIIFLVLGIGSSCVYKNAVLFPPPKTNPQPIDDVYVVQMLIDGGRPQEMDALVQAGKLPTFQELFYDQGARFQDAISVVPTVSTPAHQAFISGLFPGHHGIPNLDWFSRPLVKHIDYLKPQQISLTNTYMFNFNQVLEGEIETDQPHLIYHALAGYPTMAIFESAMSGVTLYLPSYFPLLTAYHGKVEEFYERFDIDAMKIALDKFQILPVEQLPRFTYISFYGMDLVSHFIGPKSQRVTDLYLQYDRFLRELKKTLQQRGIWDKTTLVVVSDHGQHELQKVTSLPSIIKKIGLKYNPVSPKQSQVMYGDHATAFSNLYFKMGKDWNQRPTYSDLQRYPLTPDKKINLIESFLQEPDIQFVIAPEGSSKTHIHTKDQHAVIERKIENGKTLYRYQPDPGQDPLGYLGDPKISKWVEFNKFQTSESWLQATHDKSIPDGVVLLSQIFDDYRVGEMAVFTVKDSEFKKLRASGHGSIYAEDLRVLMMLHGPAIQPGIYPYMRTVDLYPTLLALFGMKPSSSIDGIARKEIFSGLKSFSAQPDSAHDNSNGNSMLSPTEFRNKLKEKLKEKTLSKSEKDKALELLYSMDQYLMEY